MKNVLKIYVLEGCPFCKDAINELNKNNIKYKKINVYHNDKEKIKKKLNCNTFPHIMLGDKNIIGGYDNLMTIMKICDIINGLNINCDVIEYFCK